MKIGDLVQIKTEHCFAVKGYQSKALGYRRLVGVVKKIFNDDSVAVDFTQRGMPRRSDGLRPGEKARMSKRHSCAQGFPRAVLERVAK